MGVMANQNQKLQAWQVWVVLLSSGLLFMVIPSMGKPHHWTYWCAGFVLEVAIIFFTLRYRPGRTGPSH